MFKRRLLKKKIQGKTNWFSIENERWIWYEWKNLQETKLTSKIQPYTVETLLMDAYIAIKLRREFCLRVEWVRCELCACRFTVIILTARSRRHDDRVLV